MSHPKLVFKAVDPPGPAITVLHGDGFAVPGADGGWAVIPRPKWVGFTEWQGFGPYTMTIPILFDGFAQDRSIEGDYEQVRRLMRPADTPRDRPPLFTVKGPIPFSYFNWVMTAFTPGAEIRRADGARVRAAVDVELLQYVAADVLVSVRRSPAQAAQERQASAPAPPGAPAPAAPSGRTYTVHKGDTLSRIAAKELGDARRYREIADMNGIRDPNRISVGQVLRLP